MTASANFFLCLALSSVPLGVGVLGLYQFLALETVTSAQTTAIAEVCLLAYRRTIDTAGHLVIYGAIGLLLFVLSSCALKIVRGWRETRRIRAIQTEAADSRKWATVEEFRKTYLPCTEIEIFVAPEPIAITIGYLSPRILLSSGMLEVLDERELQAVLHHEAVHVARLDPLRTFISDVCRTALPFIPIIRYTASQFDAKKEIEADARAVMAMRSPVPLASALAKVIMGTMPGEAAFGVGLTPTQARIDAMLGRPLPNQSPRKFILLAALSLPSAALLSGSLYFLAHAPHMTALHICPT